MCHARAIFLDQFGPFVGRLGAKALPHYILATEPLIG